MTTTAIPTNFVDNVGAQVDAAYLNNLGQRVEDTKATSDTNASAISAIVSGTKKAVVATSESTSSTTFTDLTTTTDSVTVTIGSSGIALVFIAATMSNSAVQSSDMGFALSGANTAAASTAQELSFVSAGANYAGSYGTWFLLTGLSAGSTTFKAKYKTGAAGGTATFSNRRIAVIPFP
ncbi:hypothetical protein [Mycobacterium intracellulare]|uniref:Uncharacterized protein n=1 Tax=Mycobacterium intracellulare TaxID=1767 RepID=A0A7R7MZM6_MYCIT|nr:hypothetical protein [Mycobacterium intracellulare]BCP02509.1 hypothetical protein MINTM018_52780 [Mycobacterium intracellulare]